MLHNLQKKVILVDMDGTICNFTDKVLSLAHVRLGAPLLQSDECTAFHTHEAFAAEYQKAVESLSDEPNFFEDLEPIESAVQSLREMEKLGFHIFICTSPKKFYHNPHCAGEKHRWVMKHLGREWTERVILTRDKTVVHGDVLIDDKPEISGVVKPSWKHVYLDQPYNRMDTAKPRVKRWSDWKEVLLPLLGK